MEGALACESAPGFGAWLCSRPARGRGPGQCGMTGAKVLLYSRHEAIGSCHRDRAGAGPGVGDRDGDVAKGVRAGWRSKGFPNRLSTWDIAHLECAE